MGMPQLVVTAVLVEGRTKSEVARDYGVSRRWVITLVQRYPGRGRGRAAAALPATAHQPAAHPDRGRGRDRRGSARSSTATATRPARRRSRSTCSGGTAPPRRCPRSGGSCPPAGSSPRSRTSGPRAATSASPPNSPTSAGSPTSPTGPGRRHRRGDPQHDRRPLPAMRGQPHPAGVQGRRRRTQLPHSRCHATAIRPACSPTTVRCSPAAPAAAAGSPSRSPCTAAAIVFRHSRPYHPQTCGKVERFHQTLKKWLGQPAPRPHPAPAASPARRLPRLLQHHPAAPRPRPPHPAQAYTARPKATPTGNPIDDTATTASATTRSTPPACSPCGTTADCTTSASAAATPAPHILVLVHDLHIRVLTSDGELLRELTLDPTRDYQPQPRT